jgi:precorrin-6Y C5,15-methyltransferase (decarboxylating)
VKQAQTRSRQILVVGLTAAGADGLPPTLIERITAAELLVGGARHLAYFPAFGGATATIGADVAPVVERLRAALAEGRRAVVLASGDPLCYGIGATLRRFFPAEALEIVPAPSAFQLAFAALAEPWHGAALLSAHGRPIADVIAAALVAPIAAILTDNHNTPGALARALIAAGLSSETRCAICENLGAHDQRVVCTELAQAAEQTFAPLNVLVVWRGEEATSERGGEAKIEGDDVSPPRRVLASSPRNLASSPGLPDDAFSTSAGQITKREVRLLSLAELALGPGEVLWDIGTGSGSVAIEAARAQPSARIYAVERRAALLEHARENVRRFAAPNVTLVEGYAPEACAGWPDPHAIFVGGSAGRLEAIVNMARARLLPGARLVVNLVTLEHLQTLRALLPDARVTQAQFSRGVPIQDMLRLEALNPVFVVGWRRE